MIASLNDRKANNEDVANSNVLIEKLNDRVKHLSVIQNEFSMVLEPVK